MTPPERPDDDLLTITQISKLVGVARPTVSNWKRRHDDFPDPADPDEKRPKYHRSEVLTWLAANSRILSDTTTQPLPGTGEPAARGPRDGTAADDKTTKRPRGGPTPAARGSRASRPRNRATPSSDASKPAGRGSRAWADAVQRLRDVMAPAQLLSVLLSTLADRPMPDHGSLLDAPPDELLAARNALTADERLAAARQLLVTSSDARHSAVHLTPRPVAQLMAALMGPRSATYDPASGFGALLAEAAAAGPTTLHGQEINELTAESSRAYLQLNGVEADVRTGNSLYDDRFIGQQFPGILAAPPFGQRLDLEHISTADPRWAFVTPTRNADEAWIQHVLHHLEPGGCAVMQVAPTVLASPGNLGQLRVSLLRSGHLRAVIQLPAGCVYGVHPQFLTALIVLERTQNLMLAPDVLVAAPDLPGLDRATWTPTDIESTANTVRQWLDTNNGSAALPAGYRSVALEELSELDFDLTPRRLLTSTTVQHPPLEDIRTDLTREVAAANTAADDLRQHLLAVQPATPDQQQSTPRHPLASVPGVHVERAMRPQRLADSGATPVHTPRTLAAGDPPTQFLPETEQTDGDPPSTQPGDLLVVIDGPQLGEVYLTDEPIVASSHFAVIKLNHSELDPRYVALWLAGVEAQSRLQRAAVGTTLRRIALKDLRQLPIPIPDRATQQQIGQLRDHLATLDRTGHAIRSSIDSITELAAAAVAAALPPTGQQP